MQNLIVARHSGLVEWLRRRGIEGEVISHADNPCVLRRRDVYGVLPLHLAAQCASVTEVALPDIPPEMRGKELTAEQMDAFGAKMRRYVVRETALVGEEVRLERELSFFCPSCERDIPWNGQDVHVGDTFDCPLCGWTLTMGEPKWVDGEGEG